MTKFRNETGESIKVRRVEGKYWNWITINKNEETDIEYNYGINLGMTPVKNEENKEESEESPQENLYEELVSIKGIGKGTAQEIVQKYPTKEELLEAVSQDELNIQEDKAEIIKNTYSE